MDAEAEEKLLRDDWWFEKKLRSVVGLMTWKSSSWPKLVKVVDADPEGLGAALQNAIDPEGLADAEITEIRLAFFEGCSGRQLEQRTGVWALMPDATPRMTCYLDHNGVEYRGHTAWWVAGEGTRQGPRPALPSFDALGIQGPFQEIMHREEETEASYGIQLRHNYCATQFPPPDGEFGWSCEFAFLTMKMKVRTDVVLQLASTEPGQDGYATVTASHLSGEEACSVRLHIGDADVASLLPMLARQVGQKERRLRLVFPQGETVDWKSGSLKIISFFSFGAQNLADAPAT